MPHCKKHKCDMKGREGCNAHLTNWYCVECDKEKEDCVESEESLIEDSPTSISLEDIALKLVHLSRELKELKTLTKRLLRS